MVLLLLLFVIAGHDFVNSFFNLHRHCKHLIGQQLAFTKQLAYLFSVFESEIYSVALPLCFFCG